MPILEHRGFMLDVSRHFMPVEDVEKLIEAAALCGLNRMHWHLTDDQGWRVALERWPRLTEVGAKRGDSFFGTASGTENNDGYYTRAQVERIVAFARARDVEILPEVDLPGHASALLAAWPQLGCRHLAQDGTIVDRPRRYKVETSAGIFPNLICAGRDEALQAVFDLLDALIELFPFPMVHIGGDEALKLRWRRCPDCQKRMREEGLDSEDALQRWFMLRVGQHLIERGRRPVVWSDVLAGGPLPKTFIVQQWLNDAENVRAFMAQGGQVICSDTRAFYLDYCHGATDAHAVWRYPLPPEYARGHEENLLGVECPLWTEYVTNVDRAAFQLLPRMAAVGLRAGGDDSADWETFRERLRTLEKRVEALGLRGAPEALWHMSPEAASADRNAWEAAITAQGALPFVEYERGLVDLEHAERLMARVGMPRPFLLRAGDAMLKQLRDRAGLEPDAVPVPDADDGALELARQMMIAAKNRESGPWANLPEDVFLPTLAAFTRFVNEHHRATGRYGFDRAGWTTRQIEARLFRLGTLEYELVCDEDGAPRVDLHIPSDADLRPGPLNASVAEARRFLAQYFPAWAEARMECDSWLLSPVLKALLPEGANIPRFQTAFDLAQTDADDRQYVKWVFALSEAQGDDYALDDLPEDTSLRRGVKALMQKGRHVGSARGTLARPFA